jgi:catechol 2,3-dioxygenase-like lactoylglutathione lyase family enzyme
MLSEARVEATVPTSKLSRAREFYEGTLGLSPLSNENTPGADLVYECGGGTRLRLYEGPAMTGPAHTVAHFVVDDVEAAVRDLRGRGVSLVEYDLPELETVDGVASVGGLKFAWFRDADSNILGIHD